jgi:hypothetical protein
MPANLDFIQILLLLIALFALGVIYKLTTLLKKQTPPFYSSFKQVLKNIPLTTRLIVPASIIFILFAVGLIQFVDQLTTNTFTKVTSDLASQFIAERVRSTLSADQFNHQIRSRENVMEDHHQFAHFFEDIRAENITRVKMWDNQATIVHVHLPNSDEINFDEINQSYPEDKNYQTAMSGQVVTTIEQDVLKGQTQDENVMKIYIPIYFIGNEIPVGVTQVFYSIDNLKTELNLARRQIVITSSLGFVSLYLVLFLVSRQASNQLVRQAEELRIAGKSLEEKIEARTNQLSSAKRELERKVKQLQKFNKAVVGREIKMKQLKEEIKNLKSLLNSK